MSALKWYLQVFPMLCIVLTGCVLLSVPLDCLAASARTSKGSSSTDATSLSFVAQNKHRTRRTLYGRLCPTGCTSCSSVNGCITCQPRHFLHVQRTRNREIGVCVASCPIGHIGVRARHYSHCAKCRVTKCDVCLTKHYCTRCHGNLYEHKGQCVDTCPEGLVPGNSSRDCLPKVDCEVGEWGLWGVCARNGRSCGATFGVQTRVRHIVQFPSSTGLKCPESTVENRRCLIDEPICPAIIQSVPSQRRYKHQLKHQRNHKSKKYKYDKGTHRQLKDQVEARWKKRHRGLRQENGRPFRRLINRTKIVKTPELETKIKVLPPSAHLEKITTKGKDTNKPTTTEISNVIEPMAA